MSRYAAKNVRSNVGCDGDRDELERMESCPPISGAENKLWQKTNWTADESQDIGHRSNSFSKRARRQKSLERERIRSEILAG